LLKDRLSIGFNYGLRFNEGIKKAITWGVTVLPLKRNLIPRFRKRGHKKR
jgi:hypothetical protein